MSVQSSCSICFDNLLCSEEIDSLCTTTCGHIFHNRCITQWMKSSNTCPQCRKTVTRRDLIKLSLHIETTPLSPTFGTVGALRRSSRFNARVSLSTESTRSDSLLKTKEQEILALKREVDELKKKLKDEQDRNRIIRSDLRIIDIITLEDENATTNQSNEESIDLIDLT